MDTEKSEATQQHVLTDQIILGLAMTYLILGVGKLAYYLSVDSPKRIKPHKA